MIRTLIIAALLTVAAMHFGVSADIAFGYGLALCFTLWFVCPLLHRLARLMRRARRTLARHRPAPVTPRDPPALTQINHYHYYGHTPPPPAPAWSGPTLPTLPRRAHQQVLHDAIYDPLDEA